MIQGVAPQTLAPIFYEGLSEAAGSRRQTLDPEQRALRKPDDSNASFSRPVHTAQARETGLEVALYG